MRTSHESRYLAQFLALAVLCNSVCVLGAYTWRDCGDKLDRAFNYHSVTVYPDPVIGGQKVAVNVAAQISEDLVWTGNELSVSFNGNQIYFVNTTDMCSLTRVLQCPFRAGPISYTDIFAVPELPGGTYTFQIRNLFGKEYFQEEKGCLEVTVDISTPSLTGCSYESFVNIGFDETNAVYGTADIPSRKVGDSIQVGPSWGNLLAPWGRFHSITASSDLIISQIYGDVADLVWGLNGTLLSTTHNSDNSYSLRYTGVIFVGYTGSAYPQFASFNNALVNGTFDWTIVSNTNPPVSSLSGSIFLYSTEGIQPTGWPYILGFGRLDNFTVSTPASSGSTYLVTASKKYNTCLPTAAGTVSNQQAGSSSALTSAWTPEQKWALGLGVVGAFLIILIPLLLLLAWRQRKAQNYLNDDDLVDPLKPDYGSLAINDIIEEGDDLPKY